MNALTTSCQVDIQRDIWLQFRKMCLLEGVAASVRVREMVEAAVVANHSKQLNEQQAEQNRA